MVLCTRFYTFVSYGILHMKRKYTKSKHLVVALVVCQLLPILEVQGSNLASSPLYVLKCVLGLSFTFITCAYIYDSHLVPIVTITPFTLHLIYFPVLYNFHAIAENLHDTGNMNTNGSQQSCAALTRNRNTNGRERPCGPHRELEHERA